MAYRELTKLFYESKDTYISTYESRYNSPDTIKLNFRIKNNIAFFVQNAEASGLVFKILQTDKRISILISMLPGVAIEQFINRCLIDEIILTNKIEGVYSSRREIAAILNELEKAVEIQGKRKRFRGLVQQYYKLIANEEISFQSCEDIRRIYDELVLPEVIEENHRNAPDGKLFRKDSTSVHSVTDKEVHRGAYPESAIIKEMEEALALLNDNSIFSLYRIMIFHYLFGYIHPFYDGNGRLGRFIVSAALSREVHPLLAYRISYTIAENIKLYYNAFNVCNDPHNLGDVTPFLLMMLNIISSSALQLEDALRKRYSKLLYYQQNIDKLPYGEVARTQNTYSLLIQAGLFSENGISTKSLESCMGNSYTTIKKELDFIDSHHLLKKNRAGRDNLYMLDLESFDKILLDLNGLI
jgi:Fic family protein